MVPTFTAYPDPQLADEQVRLRRWLETDAPCVGAGKAVGGDDALAWIRRQWMRLERREGISLAIADAESDEALGYVGFLLRPSLESGIVGSTGDGSSDPEAISFRPQPLTAGIGYWVVERARGRRLATRAVRLIGRWGLTHVGLARIEALVDPANGPSLGVAERAGFQREGR